MSLTYPSELLPRPTQDYRFAVRNSTLRTRFDSGRIRQRARFSRDYRTINVRWTFDDPQFMIFQSWVKDTLNNGEQWFTVDLLQGDGFRNLSSRIVDGQYSSSYNSFLHWEVSATLEVENPDLLTSEELALLILLGADYEEFFSGVDSFHVLIHETLPTLL